MGTRALPGRHILPPCPPLTAGPPQSPGPDGPSPSPLGPVPVGVARARTDGGAIPGSSSDGPAALRPPPRWNLRLNKTPPAPRPGLRLLPNVGGALGGTRPVFPWPRPPPRCGGLLAAGARGQTTRSLMSHTGRLPWRPPSPAVRTRISPENAAGGSQRRAEKSARWSTRPSAEAKVTESESAIRSTAAALPPPGAEEDIEPSFQEKSCAAGQPTRFWGAHPVAPFPQE